MDFRSPLDRVQDVAKQHKVVGMKKDKQPERSRRRREQPKLGIAVMKDLKTSPKKLTVAAKLVKVGCSQNWAAICAARRAQTAKNQLHAVFAGQTHK